LAAPAGREGRDADDMVDIWEDFCEEYNFVLLGPISENKNGWVATEWEGVVSDINAVLGQYTIDRQRIVAHGSGIGGQMAYYLGFNARDQIRGVATVGAVLANQPKDIVPNQRLQFYIAAGEKDPIVKDIADSKPKLTERKYNVILRIVKDLGKQYINEDVKTLKELARWIDSLDRS
jgi:predicted esterase